MSGENWTPGLWLKTDNHTIYALNEGGTNRFQCQVQPGWVNGLDIKRDDERTSAEELDAVADAMRAAPTMFAVLDKAYPMVRSLYEKAQRKLSAEEERAYLQLLYDMDAAMAEARGEQEGT